MKNIFHVASKLIAVLLLGITVTGCATTHYGLEISNVPYIKEVYIRNTGATNWGTNIASNMQYIDKSRFSEKVDIKVLDANGIVYYKYNVPFNDAAFVETNKTSSINPIAGLGLLGVVLAVFNLVK